MSHNSSDNADLEKQATISPRDQPALPYVPRNFANPAPLGLIAFATSIFLVSLFGVNPRGIQHPNVIIGSMIFFGGICQYIAGIMEFVAGNTVGFSFCHPHFLVTLSWPRPVCSDFVLTTLCPIKFGATVFNSYAGFNVAYALIYIPGSGIIDAYVDAKTGAPTPEFAQALAMFVWAWFIVSVIFTVAATRSSWVLLILLVFVDLTFIFLASGFMADIPQLNTAASATGFVAAFLACEFSCWPP
jgi:succinate-acetate transporter protein